MPDTQATQDARPRHPLDPLTPLEITQVVAIVRAEPELPPSLLFEMIELMEPPKSVVRSFNPGDAFTRQARVNLFPSGDIGVWRLVVSLDEEKVIAPIGHHQIVAYAAGLIGEHGIAHPSRGQALNVRRHQRLECRRPAGTANRYLSHMRDVEQRRFLARVQVFGEDAGGILHRHVVPREGDHPRPEFAMQRMQRCALENLFGCCVHRVPG